MLVPCHSPRSAAHCATRRRLRVIASILSQERFDSRSALGRRICEEFSFADARGRPQLAGCMKALGALAERVADIVLPAAEGLGGGAPGAPAQHRCPRARRSSSASRADTGSRDRCRRGRGGPGPVEHADRTRAPARDDDLRGLPGPLPPSVRRTVGSGRRDLPPPRCEPRRATAGSDGTTPGAGAIFSASCA